MRIQPMEQVRPARTTAIRPMSAPARSGVEPRTGRNSRGVVRSGSLAGHLAMLRREEQRKKEADSQNAHVKSIL
jgi:hypothetical protein